MSPAPGVAGRRATLRDPAGSAAPLSPSTEPLTARHDVALVDLDGVVYLGRSPVPGAAQALADAVAAGLRLGFVTNNASRTPAQVATQLADVGVPADPAQVVTSAQTGARVLARQLTPGARVLVVGTAALAEQIAEQGLRPVRDLDAPVAGVIQGFSPDTGWRELAAATRAVREGACWLATNGDLTVPSVDGPLPGNGAFVAVVATASGRTPQVTGKPDPAMHEECLERLAATRPIVVGDRLDTDIEGAAGVGCPSLLVFTGVTRPADVLAADPQQRPTYLAADLRGLLTAHPPVVAETDGWRCGGWRAADGDLAWTAKGTGGADEGDPYDALRALCADAWSRGDVTVGPRDARAERALADLGLTR